MTRKKSLAEFLEEARSVHGDKYDYSQVDYQGNKVKVKIGCPVHGYFWQVPKLHLKGSNCPKCNKSYKLSQEMFKKKATLKHKNKYRYQKSIYKNVRTPVIITCPIHGDFLQKPREHLSGHGCPVCANALPVSKDIFLQRAAQIHKNFYIYDKINYENRNIKVEIICPKHGSFWQTPSKHLFGQGCPKCAIEKSRISFEDFISRANKIHDNKYNYSKVKILGTRNKIEIICPKHGSFWQTVDVHLSGHGCPLCKQSKGEFSISKYLKSKKLKYIPQYKIKGCVYKKPLPFDFAIFNKDGSLRCLIEYQGEQHFKIVPCWGGKKAFEEICKRDAIKNFFCLKHKIPLFCIKYTENITNILDNILGNIEETGKPKED